MALEIGALLGLAYSLCSLCYVCSVLIRALPFPNQDLKKWAPDLLEDAIYGEVALGTVSAVQLAVTAISNLLGTSLGGPFDSPATSLSTILSQLIELDAIIFSLISTSTIPILNRMLNQCMVWSATGMVTWSLIHLILSFLPTLWLTVYVLGLCFFVVPFRIGRRLGSYMMAASIILAIGLPLMPSIALWMQDNIGYHLYLIKFEEIIGQIDGSTSTVLGFMEIVQTTIGNLMASTIISLIIFPVVYIFMLSQLIRGLARVIGGTSVRFNLLRYFIIL